MIKFFGYVSHLIVYMLLILFFNMVIAAMFDVPHEYVDPLFYAAFMGGVAGWLSEAFGSAVTETIRKWKDN